MGFSIFKILKKKFSFSSRFMRILNLNREENEIYVSDSHKSRREREFFLQNLENGEEKENENSIFSSERERARSVFLEIRDSCPCLPPRPAPPRLAPPRGN